MTINRREERGMRNMVHYVDEEDLRTPHIVHDRSEVGRESDSRADGERQRRRVKSESGRL